MLITEDIVVNFTHIFREANRCADAMAKMRFIHDPRPHSFRNCPDFMFSLLAKYLSGVFISRISCL